MRLGRAKPRSERLMAEVELLRAIPEVSDRWEVQSRWRTYREGPWRWPEDHISIKESRDSIMALERHVRSAQQHRCRLFQPSDNLVSVLAFDKGRPKSGALNTLCRRVCALVVVCDIVRRLRHIRSEKNAFDEGSRKESIGRP